MLPLISIIVPIYNVEKYLVRCINSLVNQTYENLEILLVNDGATDSSPQIVDEFAEKDKRIKALHKENGGLSDARNYGIDRAKGEYLFFIDSDDWLDVDTIQVLQQIASEYQADIVECSYRNVYREEIIEESKCTASIIVADRIKALEGMLDWKYFKAVAWNKLYHRSVIGDIRFPKGKIHEDEFTIYKYIYNAKKIVYIDVSKCNYDRTRESSITGVKFSEKNLYGVLALRERIDFFREHGITEIEEKMNNVYCYVLFDRMNKVVENGISGKLVNEVLEQVKKDVLYFENRPVQERYLKDMNILAKGLKTYSRYRIYN